MGDRVRVYEVGPRDGLQNEDALISTAHKIELIERLSRAGLEYFEATSFVSPKAVPQLSDGATVIEAARRLADLRPTLRFNALVVNEKGYDRACEAGATGVAIVVVLSEKLCQRNNRCSTEEALATARRLLVRASTDRVFARVYIAPAWVCPYEGPMSQDHVLRCCDTVWEAGCDELAISDTIGYAHPLEVGHLFDRLGQRYGTSKLAAHLHDTQALALANAAVAIQAGIRIIDASVAGLGGCPFAPGAAGNLATEDLVLMLEKMGFRTDVDLQHLWEVVEWLELVVERPVGGRTKAWWAKQSDVKDDPTREPRFRA
jgi:hydroxymethylglutaryl-CoA lyase